MNAENIISRLEAVRKTGRSSWVARCPAHDDRRPSLSITECDDGRILAHCFAGCDVETVLSSIGMTMQDLMPERIADHCPPERRPFPASDCLRAVAFEALVVVTAGAALLAGEPVELDDRARVMEAIERIQDAFNMSGVSYA